VRGQPEHRGFSDREPCFFYFRFIYRYAIDGDFDSASLILILISPLMILAGQYGGHGGHFMLYWRM
jgi:hypothetical protein